MKIKSLKQALKRAGLSEKILLNSQQHYINMNGRVLSWYEQDEYVQCLHCRREDDHTDLHTDYFAGFFPRTLKRAIAYITEPQ